jgi:hypothetical protein
MGYYLIANTQDLENYGAHDWNPDTSQDCPQYWKYKGGTSLGIVLGEEDITTRDANYAARCINELNDAEMLEHNNYFMTYYTGHEIVEARDLFIQYADEEPDSRQYEFYGLIHFPHLEAKLTRFCWIKRMRSTHPEWK